MIAAGILVYREGGAAGVAALVRRSFDHRRIRVKVWYVPALLLLPAVHATTYGLMRLLREPLPIAQLPLLAALGWILGFFVAAECEELGWSGYVTDPLQAQARWTALGAARLLGVVWPRLTRCRWCRCTSRRHGRPGEVSPRWRCGYFSSGSNNTSQSVFATALFHAMGNLSQIGPFLDFGGSGYSYDAQRIDSLILVIAVVIVTVVRGPHTLRSTLGSAAGR